MRSMNAKSFFLSLLLLILAYSGAEGAPARGNNTGGKDLEDLPRVSSFRLHQMGANDLMVDIEGNSMPLPQVSSDGSITMIILPGVSGENVPEHVNEDLEGMAPLVTSVRSRQTGDDFVITIMTSASLQANAIRGVPPSGAYTLHLKTAEQQQKIIEERVATDHPQALRVPTGPFASNDPITLDLRDTELRDVFRMFGEQVKKNIVIHDSLPPVLVTMTFKNSPLRNVFSYLMNNYDLAYEFIDNNTIVVGTASGLARISGKQETRAYRVAYAEPGAVSGILPNLLGITDLSMVVDDRLRTIYATCTPDVHEKVLIAIQELDNPGKQVMLHARILQFRDEDTDTVTRVLNAAYDHWLVSYGGNTLNIDYNTESNSVEKMLTIELGALESKNRIKTLANPSVVTIDGMEATVNLMEEHIYRTGQDDAGNDEFDTIEVGPNLTMTPRIGRDGIITLTLDLAASERLNMEESDTDALVATANREVTTNVRVRDGEPFVVGGLFREDTTNNRLRIPILGQLPLLGELFTFRGNDETTTTQVVMIVIPYILDTPDVAVDYQRILMRN